MLKKLVISSVLFAFLTCPVFAGDKKVKIYDEDYRYKGFVQDNGKIYDENYRYKGRIISNKVYDEDYRLKGRLEKSGGGKKSSRKASKDDYESSSDD